MLGMTITQREAEELIREEGNAEGIVQTFKELGQSIDKAIDNLIKKLSPSHDEAEKLAKQYWK